MSSLLKDHHLKYISSNQIYCALRIACAMCFIGHGAFGIITKEIWTAYFGVFGIGHEAAYSLMPVVGVIDIICGLFILFYPVKAVIAWLVLWGLTTALLRPISGEPFPEVIERAGNFGAPLALILIWGGVSLKNIFKPLHPNLNFNANTLKSLTIVLRIVVCLLLVGHGWLNVIEKKALINQYDAIGFADPASIAQFVGFFEIFAGLLVLIRPNGYFILFLFIWKMSTELFYPQHELFEWIERGGSYGCILALWFTVRPAAAKTKAIKIKSMDTTLVDINQKSLNLFILNHPYK